MRTGRRWTADDILRQRTQSWPEAVTPVTQLMVRVFRLGNLVLDNATGRMAAHGLGFSEFEVLVTLRGVPPPHELVPTELYGAILISSGGLTKVLRALERRKLVTRGQSRTDRRSKPVRLTARGRALAERAMADVVRSDGELISRGLSQAEVERLTGLLRKLLAALEPTDRLRSRVRGLQRNGLGARYPKYASRTSARSASSSGRPAATTRPLDST
jgi:DNA-binding MarR family transcriptional regulator